MAPGVDGQFYFPSAAEILAKPDIVFEVVRVPEWDIEGKPPVAVRIQGLTGKERDAYEMSIMQGKGQNREMNVRNARAKLVQKSARLADGKHLFTEDQIRALGDKSALAMERLFDVARRLSGLTDTDVKELTENFD